MDVSGVSQSIQAVNDVMQSAVAQSTQQSEKMVKAAVEMAVTGGKEAGKGEIIDLYA